MVSCFMKSSYRWSHRNKNGIWRASRRKPGVKWWTRRAYASTLEMESANLIASGCLYSRSVVVSWKQVTSEDRVPTKRPWRNPHPSKDQQSSVNTSQSTILYLRRKGPVDQWHCKRFLPPVQLGRAAMQTFLRRCSSRASVFFHRGAERIPLVLKTLDVLGAILPDDLQYKLPS